MNEDDDGDDEDDDAKLHRGINAVLATAVTTEERDQAARARQGRAHADLRAVGRHRRTRCSRRSTWASGRAEKKLDLRTLVPPQPTPWTRGRRAGGGSGAVATCDLPGGATPLLVDERFDAPVAALVPYGQGQVIVIGAPELAMNKALARADNARFWLLALLRRGQGRRGVDSTSSTTASPASARWPSSPRRYGLQFAVLQLLLGRGALGRLAAPLRPPARPERGRSASAAPTRCSPPAGSTARAATTPTPRCAIVEGADQPSFAPHRRRLPRAPSRRRGLRGPAAEGPARAGRRPRAGAPCAPARRRARPTCSSSPPPPRSPARCCRRSRFKSGPARRKLRCGSRPPNRGRDDAQPAYAPPPPVSPPVSTAVALANAAARGRRSPRCARPWSARTRRSS